MAAVTAGRTNRQVAAQLGISERTVEVHRAEVMAKMHADSVAALVEMALRLDGARP